MNAEVLGWTTTAIFCACTLPQIWKSWRTHRVTDISPWSWWLQGLGYLTGMAYALTIGQNPLLFSYAFGLLMTITYLRIYRWCKACRHCGQQEDDHCESTLYPQTTAEHFGSCTYQHHTFIPKDTK